MFGFGEKKMELRLGNMARDASTGFTGRLIQKSVETNGNVRFSIQPLAKEDGTIPEGWFIDLHMIDFLEDGVADRVPPLQEAEFKAGDKLRDKISGFEGILTTTYWFLNGCIHYEVVSEKLTKEGATQAIHLPKERVEKVEAPAHKMAAVPQTRTGGPMTRSISR